MRRRIVADTGLVARYSVIQSSDPYAFVGSAGSQKDSQRRLSQISPGMSSSDAGL
jgi:hypothetical protein